jgi:hypothetical protein
MREAIGVFSDSTALETVVSELQSHGFDRADISFISGTTVERTGTENARSIADNPSVDRQASVSDSDIRQGRTLGTGMAATAAAFAAAGVAAATGGTALIVAAAAVVAAGGVGAISEVAGRVAGAATSSFRDADLTGGGVLLVVRLRDGIAESHARDILQRYSQRDVVVHDVEVPAA